MQELRGSKIEIITQPSRSMPTLRPIQANRTRLHPILIETQPRIENQVKYMNPKEKTFSNQNKKRLFAGPSRLMREARNPAPGNPVTVHLPFTVMPAQSGAQTVANCSKINRNIALIESPVSRSKQKAAPQINRNISATLPLRIFPFHFSIFHLHGETPSVDLNFGVWFRASGALPCVTRRASSGTLEGAFSCPMK